MRTTRRWLLLASTVAAAAVAYLARHAVHQLILLPLAYGLWQLRALMAGVAQVIQWAILITVMALIMVWELVPKLAPRRRTAGPASARDGQVDATALCLMRARSSNYFRWQLANRLGRVAIQLSSRPGTDSALGSLSDRVAGYVDAGLNHSFVEYAASRFLFRRAAAGPLSIDPAEAVQHLESQLSQGGGLHA